MEIEKLIKDTFTAHEHDAPDDDAVFAAAQRRIHRRRIVQSRPLAVAAGVVVLTLAAVTVVALNRSGPTPADEGRVAAGPTNKAPAEPAVPELSMPFALGWLPDGPVGHQVHRINIGGAAEDPDTPVYGGEYMLTATVDGQVLDIDVQEFRMMPVDEAAFKSGPGSPVTIGGKRGVESSISDGPGGYEVYVEHPDEGSMYVNVAAGIDSTVPAQRLVDIGRKIAEHITFPGAATVAPMFGLRDLPGGMRICAFEVDGGTDPDTPKGGREPSTTYQLGTCATVPPVVVGTNSINPPHGKPGRPVQGHETRYVDERGYRTLWVLDAVDGAPVVLAGRVPPSELYDVANRLVLPD